MRRSFCTLNNAVSVEWKDLCADCMHSVIRIFELRQSKVCMKITFSMDLETKDRRLEAVW